MTAIARSAAPSGASRWRSWGLIVGLLMVMTVSHGIISAGLPALDSAILEDLGISRGALKLRETIFLLSSGCSGLLIGFLTLRVQPARIVHLGLILLAATLFTYSYATSIEQIYLLYVLLGLCFACSHVVIVVLMVREWFATKRTLAISIALSGTSIGAAIFPNVTVAALEGLDWREVVRWAAIVPLVVLPAALVLVRGGQAAALADEAGSRPAQATAPHLRRPLALALLMMATFGTFFASTAFLLNLFLYLQDIGMNARSAAMGLSVVFITGLVGKVLVGMAAEKWGTNRVWNSQQLILLAGALVLSITTPAFAFLGLLLLGAGWAGCYVLTQVVIADYFAGPRLGQYTGAFIVFEAIASGMGVWAAGATFDVFGSYRPGFYVCTALIAVAVVCGYCFRRVMASTERETSA
ncbi:MFS transporter [Pelagerythrobacter sp.]|uniref:MFS transporter n=1 Tax=Pelagerythrobacter sp. TaxID=2800702 RepID=UPI0035AE6061